MPRRANDDVSVTPNDYGWSINWYIHAAKDLGYSAEVIKKLKQAKTQAEATRVMATAREESIKKDRGWRPSVKKPGQR